MCEYDGNKTHEIQLTTSLQSDDNIPSEKPKNRITSKLAAWSEKRHSEKEHKREKEIEAAKDWAIKREYQRPFSALTEMPSLKRQNILKTLNLWSSLNGDCEDTRLSSKMILDAELKGIAGRLHTRAEQLRPNFNLTWRQMLMRVLDEHLNLHYSADLEEFELEYLLLQTLERSIKYTPKKGAKLLNLPSKFPKHKTFSQASIILDVINGVDAVFEKVLNAEDKPAIDAMLSIIKWIHVDGPEADLEVEEMGVTLGGEIADESH